MHDSQGNDPLAVGPGPRKPGSAAKWALAGILAVLASGCSGGSEPKPEGPEQLTHGQTLEWIRQNRAWRLAKKTRPIWVRPLAREELGKDFQTADRAKEIGREGYWLCVGSAGEPWFQKPERVKDRYEPAESEAKTFSFDLEPARYQLYRPKGDTRNWAAQIKGPGITGFHIQPNYETDHPLYAPAGGYVVMDHVSDPYQADPKEVWLVQEPLFTSTYEMIP